MCVESIDSVNNVLLHNNISLFISVTFYINKLKYNFFKVVYQKKI